MIEHLWCLFLPLWISVKVAGHRSSYPQKLNCTGFSTVPVKIKKKKKFQVLKVVLALKTTQGQSKLLSSLLEKTYREFNFRQVWEFFIMDLKWPLPLIYQYYQNIMINSHRYLECYAVNEKSNHITCFVRLLVHGNLKLLSVVRHITCF